MMKMENSLLILLQSNPFKTSFFKLKKTTILI